MALNLQPRPERKNAQFRLCDEAIAAVDTLLAHYGERFSRSDIVEAVLLEAANNIQPPKTRKG